MAQLKAQQADRVLNDLEASDEQRAQAAADLANANRTLAAEQQNYDNWKEGGAARVLAHTLVGGLTGNLQGAAGAALASAAAPALENLTKNLPAGVKDAVSAGLAAGLGAASGGVAGAAAGINEEFNNRQLHPTEGTLIRGNAQAYATKRGISVEQATTELTEQSLRQIDSAWANRIADNPQAAAFLREVARSAGAGDVGGGGLFDARGTSAYADHTVNADALGQTSDLYNRITHGNTSGIVPGVRGAYVAYADAGTDPRLAHNTPEQIQQLLNTGRQLRQEGESVREGFAINAANLSVSQTVFTSGLARPGDGSRLADRAIGEMGEAALSGLPSEGGAVTAPTRGMRPGAVAASASREGRPGVGPEDVGSANPPSNRRTSSATCSFRGDMLVKTSAGYTRIMDVQVGDSVYARDESTGVSDYKAVLAHYSNPYKEAVYVSVKDASGSVQVIVSNAIHPFFAQVPGAEAGTVLPRASDGHDYRGPIAHAQWVDASNLKIGYRLLGSAGNWLEVSGLKQTNEQLQAHNLTVADFHTYFISGGSGDEGVWVHNDCWSSLPKEAVATGKTTPDGRRLYTFKDADGKNVTAYQGKNGDTQWYDPKVYAPDLPAPRGMAVESPPEPVVASPPVLTAAEQATALGYRKTSEYSKFGEPIYFNNSAPKNRQYISRDVGSENGKGSHNGGFWKAASSVKNLGQNTTRTGTFNATLEEKVGK